MPVLPVVVQVDNAQAKSFKEGTCVQSRLRGTFDIREQWVQELRSKHELQVELVPSSNNCADLLTKVQKTSRFRQLLCLLQGRTVVKMVANSAMLAMVAIQSA